MDRRGVLAAALAVACGLAPCKTACAAEAGLDVKVEAAIGKGMKYLWSQQQGDGSWRDVRSGGLEIQGPDRQIALSSLITYSLLASGAEVTDPRIVKSLTWLARQRTGWNYAVSMRSQAFLEAAKQDLRYKPQVMRDAVLLIKAAGRSRPYGSYGYRLDRPGNTDPSNAQYGVLGVWAAHQLQGEVPRQYWSEVMKYWLGIQERDGGWKYRKSDKNSTATMTSAGVATLFVCVDALLSARFTQCRRTESLALLRKPMAWFDKHFPETLKNEGLCHGGHGDTYYYLFGVERVGLASGYKYFGKVDWYRLGAQWLLGQQQGNGSWNGKWGPTPATAYALLFLARGQRAVLFNRLEYGGDWNNRPRALANYCRYARKAFEQDVYWQIINLEVDPAEWHDAPIVVISGSIAPTLSDVDIARLRAFVHQGGTLLSVTECKGKGFQEGMRETYEKLFPSRALAPLPKDHKLYSIHGKLEGKPEMFVLSNGARPLAIHTDEDLCLDWQLNRWVTQRGSYDAASNIVMYVTGKTLRKRGAAHWPKRPGKVDGPTVRLVRVKYDGNWDPEPLAWERVSRRIAADAKVNLEIGEPVAVKDLPSSGAAVAVMTGTSAIDLGEADGKALEAYVAGGGLLVVDAAGGYTGGGRDFARSAENALDGVFGRRALRTLSESSELFRMKGWAIDRVHYHMQTKHRLGTTAPQLKAVLDGERIGVLFSREDLTTALIGCAPANCDGYTPRSAYEIARNVVLYAAKPKKK